MSTPTIPSRLARLALSSANVQEARQRSIQLYREWYRAAPEIVTMYALDIPPSQVRHALRERFEQNRNVADVKVIDRLLHQSRVDFQETMNGWKQTPHIMGILLESKRRAPQTFLQAFYKGRDENQVIAGPVDLR